MLMVEIVESTIGEINILDKEEIIVVEIENLFKICNLKITQKTTLLSKKGSIHWHLKKGNEKGVLEVTYWMSQDKLWLEVHDNRRAEWNEKVIVTLANEMTRVFGGKVQIK